MLTFSGALRRSRTCRRYLATYPPRYSTYGWAQSRRRLAFQPLYSTRALRRVLWLLAAVSPIPIGFLVGVVLEWPPWAVLAAVLLTASLLGLAAPFF